MRKKELTILIILTIVISNLVFLFGYKLVLYNQNFYENEFETNKIYEKYNKSFVDEQHKEVMEYLVTSKPIITSNEFSKQDKQHLRDVESLMKRIDYYSYFLVILILLIFVYLHLFYKKIKDKVFSKAVYLSSCLNLIIVGIIYLLSLNFEWFFIKFHELSFNNDLWMMDPRVDLLVNLYPEQFWVHAVSKVLISILIISVIFGVIGYLGNYFISKHKFKSQVVSKP
ncbi:TIGR01906 family membrane protein [Candidatus Woesearchaeota archaeon]|jgi:integral membrane protein (TIGR01906 family)|nr:TIGR01906 family membrane protein [Candidatus Woesearchaeota archaeon]